MIGPDRLRRAEYLIDSSHAVEFLTPLLRASRRGRKYEANKLRVFLIALFLTIENERTGSVKAVAATMHENIPLQCQYRLGIRNPDNGKASITKSDFYYLTKLFTRRLGYGKSVIGVAGIDRADSDSHAPDPAASADGRDGAGITSDERERRHRDVQSICRRLLAATIVGPEPTAYAIDATGIWSWGKGPRKPTKAELSASIDDPADLEDLDETARPSTTEVLSVGSKSVHDPDAAWGVKTAKSGATEVFFGYHEHTLVQVPGPGEHSDVAPRLIRAFELTPANADVVDVSLRLLDSVHDGGSSKLLLADNHYHYKQFQRWLRPLRERNWDPLHDMRVNEQGFDEHARMRWAAGHAHCPATPDSLGTILRPAPNDKRRDAHQAFAKQISLRQSHSMMMHTLPDLDGMHRVTCPALDGKVGCRLRPGTDAAAIASGLPIIENPPDPNGLEGLPACCTQRTVRVRPPEPIAKLYQSRYWGSEEWSDLYSRRTYVEGSYGNRKNSSTENLRRGLFHITGLPLVHLMLTMVNMSYNLRMIENWRQRCLDADKPTDPLGPGHPLVVDDSQIAGYRAVTRAEEYGEAIDAA